MNEPVNGAPAARQARTNRFLSRAQLEAWAQHYARAKDVETEGVWKAAEWLVFRAGGNRFTVAVEALDEIAGARDGVMLPHRPAALLGLVNLRGETVLLVDMARLLGLPGPQARDPSQRVLLFRDGEGRATGFLVEAVETVANLDPTRFQERAGDDEADAALVEAVGEMDGAAVARINVAALLRAVDEMLNP